MADAKAFDVSAIPGVESVKKMYEDSAGRVGQLFDEVGKAHTKWIEYGNTQIDEMNEVLKTQFNYVNDLAASWRKLSMETVKKSIDALSK